MTVRSTVAIVGRPNVGKSTLFNRLIGRRQAIVHNEPGVTRDRITGIAELTLDHSIHLIDTGGLVPGDDPLGLNEQVRMAIEESDLVVMVVDGRDGLVPADEEVCAFLRRFDKPVVLAVNKADVRRAEEGFAEFHRLGIEPQLLISAEHGLGIADLRARVLERLPSVEAPAATPEAIAVAIVGRPNVGKSSLLNRLVGDERSLVSEVAGTTRDPVDTLLEHDEFRCLLVDTAGIRRRSRVTGTPEELAVMMAERQLERGQLAILVIDAAQGVTSGDLAIAGRAWDLGRAVLVVFNKWDLLDEKAREDLEIGWERLATLLAEPARINVSARTGRSMNKILPALEELATRYRTELDTAEVNRLFRQAAERHHAPMETGKPWKLYYATQVSTGPPTFMLFANRTIPRRAPYRRYLENQLRQHLDCGGVPVRLVIRRRS
jgi:GTP-binding protein